jgi:hypothetical protein
VAVHRQILGDLFSQRGRRRDFVGAPPRQGQEAGQACDQQDGKKYFFPHEGSFFPKPDYTKLKTKAKGKKRRQGFSPPVSRLLATRWGAWFIFNKLNLLLEFC